MAKRREIVLADVQFSDSDGVKTRPAIILSDERYSQSGFVLICPITTAEDAYCLAIEETDVNCILKEGSGARFDEISRIKREYIHAYIGKVTPQYYAQLVEHIFSLVRPNIQPNKNGVSA